MIVVVADASPIHYLIQIGETQLLPLLFHRIVIPIEVFSPVDRWRCPRGSPRVDTPTPIVGGGQKRTSPRP